MNQIPEEKPLPSNGGLAAIKRSATVQDSMFYMGSLMSFLISGDETNGRFCLMEYSSRPGNEPPPHLHIGQDELFYLLEGELEVYWNHEILQVTAGESLFLPRDQAHAWYVRSPSLRALILTQPAGLDDYFRAMAVPADSLHLPPTGITYAMDDPDHAIRVGKQFGIRILTPAETSVLLPHYPGFPRPD